MNQDVIVVVTIGGVIFRQVFSVGVSMAEFQKNIIDLLASKAQAWALADQPGDANAIPSDSVGS